MRKFLGILSFVLLLTILIACRDNTTKTFTVTFESNGGSAVTAIEDVEDGDTINAPGNPTRSGYTFAGWYKDAALTDDFVFATDTVTEDITLYAKWNAVVVTFTVTFNSNGGSAVASLTNVANGALITAPTAPTRTGFTFVGWYQESALTTAWNFASDTVTENMTLYAKWEAVGPTDQQKVDAVYAWLNLTNLTDLTNASPRIIMPVENMEYPGVTISWDISNTAVIQTNGVIVQPANEVGDVTVTLTATITAGSITREKEFTATVKALPGDDEMPPLINETFNDYNDGNIIGQTGPWMPVSGKTGSSLFTVVSTITGMSIPEGSKALMIEAMTELQIEAPIAHGYDVLVIEVDLLQTVSSNGSPIHIQSSASSPVIGFGLNGSNLYYRVDNGSMDTNYIQVTINEWIRARMEIDLVNKTIQGFYYQDGQLMAIGEPMTYTGSTPLQSLFIRSGSSTTTELRAPAYITNIVANRIESLPRPEEMVKLGEVTGIRETVNQAEGEAFTPDTPTVFNLYGSQSELTLTEDYTVEIANPVDINVPDTYVVIYTITNANDPLDVKVIYQEVTIYAVAQPNVIDSVESTDVDYFTHESTITITLQRPEGTLYYLLSNNATESAEDIIANGQELPVSQAVIELIGLVVEFDYIHVVVVLNGNSNVVSHGFVDQNVNLITTTEQFYQMASVENTGINVLMNDLDFTGFEWTVTSASFKGQLHGQGHIISNLVINLPAAASNTYGGIFARTNGAYIENLVLDNITVTTPARAGILTGRNENTLSTFKNIVVMNSSVTGGDSNGVGGLIGLVSGATVLENITIAYTEVIANGVKNAGGVVGRVDGTTLTATDIFITNVSVSSTVGDGTDHGIGGFVGYVRDNIASIVTASRIVIEDTTLDAPIAGALIGYLRSPGTATVTDAYFTVEMIATVRSGVVGRINVPESALANATLFGIIVGEMVDPSAQPLVNDLSEVTVDNAWWQTNLASIFNSDIWTVTDGRAILDLYGIFMLEEFDVTLMYNAGDPSEIIMIRDGFPFVHTAPEVPGYQFVGWFLDALMENPVPEGYVITENQTLYGKYETVPASTVTFNTNIEGVLVDEQLINYGEYATEPVVPETMDGGVLKYVSGWTLDGVPFNFGTQAITTSITLEAVWSVVEYTVTFESGDSIEVPYGQLATEPVEDPTHPMFAELTFAGWTLSGVLYDFNTPVTSDLTLNISWNTPVSPIEITTAEQFHFMTISGYSYDFVLANDIDFTSFTWVSEAAYPAFKGTLDGQGFEVSYIQMSIPSPVADQFGGIFSRLDGAEVRNLIIDHITVSAGGRAGGLVGRIIGDGALIENIIVRNASISGNDSNGVGGLIGLVSANSEVYHVAVIDSTISNANKNVGGLVGRVDSASLMADDIFIANNAIESLSTASSDVGAGGLVGYVRDNANSLLSGVRIVIINTAVTGNSGGILAGYVRYPGQIAIMDAYLSGSIFGTRTGLVGYWRDFPVEYVFDQSSIFTTLAANTPHSQTLQVANEVVAPTDLTWWNTNLEAFVLSDFWTVGNDGSIVLDMVNDGIPQP